MSVNFGIPRPESRLVSPDGTVSREWYLFLSALLQSIGGPSVGPGGGASPVDNAMQFEEYPLSVPDAMEALRGVDELRNDLSSLRGDGQAFRSRMDDIESLIDAARPLPLPVPFPTTEAFTAPTLLNSWVNYGSGYNSAGYYKDPFGIVHLRGLVKSGTIGLDIFTLPAGYRPAASENLACVSNGAFGQCVISSAGGVTPAAGSNLSFSLDGLTFRAA